MLLRTAAIPSASFSIQQPAIGTFIAGLGIVEAVLPVVDVADIDVEPGEPPGISFSGEDLPRPLRRGECAVVLAQQKHRLDRSAKRACHFVTLAYRLEPGDGLFVKIDRSRVFAAGIQNIRLRSQRAGQGLFIVELAGNGESGFSQAQGPLNVHADLLAYLVSELGDDFRLEQGRVLRNEIRAWPASSGRSASCANRLSWSGGRGPSPETLFLQPLPQQLQAPPSNESDRAGGEFQLSGDFFVGAGRIVKKKQSDQAIAPGGKRGDRVAQHLLPLQLVEHLFGQVLGSRASGCCSISAGSSKSIEALFFGAQAFVIAGLHEPLGRALAARANGANR